jgi:hypothetical protein
MLGGGCRGGTPAAPLTAETAVLLVLRTTGGLMVEVGMEPIETEVVVTPDINTGVGVFATATGGDMGRSFEAATTLSCTSVSISKE